MIVGCYLWAATDWSPPDLDDERAFAAQMVQVDAARVVTVEERPAPRINLNPLVVCCDDGGASIGAVVVTYEGEDLDAIENAVEVRLRSKGWEPHGSLWSGPPAAGHFWCTVTRDDDATEVRLRVGRIEG
ncbi:hypothetical protein Dac01nite_07430 [Demequina activiva]|uniref:Uncharacterized protein n=1 Tax=Demequina activiva TaxID=1582364 RepID=A0A919Q333_9MICO|nr:hypothetical protein Dac01nite_07430 [Demequina activiva]